MKRIANKMIRLLLFPAAFLLTIAISNIALADTAPVSPTTLKNTTTTQTLDESKVLAEAALVLDNLHQTASHADWDSYFSLYLSDAIFIGTDATEHWTMDEFQQYARPTQGWSYTLTNRKLTKVGRLDKLIVFDELLDSGSYGVSRGTGTLVLTDKGWKIAQYHLSFPIPNKLAKEITGLIKHESK